VRSAAEVAAAWQYAESAGRVRGSRVIVEGFIDFDYEITLLTVRADDENGDVQTYFCEPIGHVQRNGDYVESWQPQPMPAAALGEIADIAQRITAELGGHGDFGVESLRRARMWFSEVSPARTTPAW
jgi:phosphoribosylglycinamide formyltransferase 2